MSRIQEAMAAVFDDVDGVLAEVAAMAGEALEFNRGETTRLKGEIADADKMLAGLTRLLIDPEIEALAKRSLSRQIAECESRRESLREALASVAVQAVDDMDALMAASRQAFAEAKANFAGLMTPAQVNRFVAEVVGPMRVMRDGTVGQNDNTPRVETLGAVPIEGG